MVKKPANVAEFRFPILPSSEHREKGDPYPEEIRQKAYEAWCLRANRNYQRVVEILWEEDRIEVNYSTVAYWAKSEKWVERYTDEMEQMFPYSRKETAANLVAAALQSSRMLLGHFNGIPINRGDEKIIFGALDRAGFSPVGSRDPVAASNTSETAAVRQSSLVEKLLTPDDLEEIAAEARGTDVTDDGIVEGTFTET